MEKLTKKYFDDVGVAIFAKTPGFSSLKTRLANDTGKDFAIRFYLSSVSKIVRELSKSIIGSNLNVSVYLAHAEPESADYWGFLPTKKIWQGEGELGTRLSEIESVVLKRHKAVLFLGADCPFVSSPTLEECCAKLLKKDVVVGRAEDGGFYLLATKVLLGEGFWNSIPYSEPTTCQILVNRLKSNHIGYEEIETKYDIDNIGDLWRYSVGRDE